MAREWCAVCCGPVGETHRCPGPLLATGRERPGWRGRLETPCGGVTVGVLLAPSQTLWRARILTYPARLWCVPGGGSLKFAGRTPEEAESKAVAFIEERFASRVRGRRTSTDRPAIAPSQASPRKPCRLPVRFGAAQPLRTGVTLNVSREGLFIGTDVPLDAGTPVRLRLDVAGYTLPLKGVVIWNRRRREPGRPLGMGVRLVDPLPSYPRLVDRLPGARSPSASTPPAGATGT